MSMWGEPSQTKEFNERESQALGNQMNYKAANADYSAWGLYYSQFYRLKVDFIQSIRLVKMGSRFEVVEGFHNSLCNLDDLLTMMAGIVPRQDILDLDKQIETLELKFNEWVRKMKVTKRPIDYALVKELKDIFRYINFIAQRHGLGLPVSQSGESDYVTMMAKTIEGQ